MIGRHTKILERLSKSAELPIILATREELIQLLVYDGKSLEEAESIAKITTILGSEVVAGNKRVKLKPLA